MSSIKITYGSHTWQCCSYATCANLSKADAKSTNNEWRLKLMRSTRLSLGLALTRFRYLTHFPETGKCNSCFVTIPNNTEEEILLPGRLIPSPRMDFGGLSPQTMHQAPPNWNMKHYKSVEFCQFLQCQAPLQKSKALCWRLSGDGSVADR